MTQKSFKSLFRYWFRYNRELKKMEFRKTLAVSFLVFIVFMAAPAAAGLIFESSCPQTIAEGDTFTIHGTGATNGSVTLLIFGRHYFHTFAADPDNKGDFSFILGPEETRNFSAGQYAFVIQDPGANGQSEIGTRISGYGNITVTDRGVTVADLGPSAGLKPWVRSEVETLMAASERAGVDDIFRAEYFFVELPSLHFDQQSDPETGRLILDSNNPRRMVFSGITNMAPENILTAQIRDATSGKEIFIDTVPAITPVTGTEPGRHSYWNTWYYSLDPARLSPGEYSITVGWQKESWCGTGTALFMVPDAEAPARSVPGPYLFSLMDSGIFAGL